MNTVGMSDSHHVKAEYRTTAIHDLTFVRLRESQHLKAEYHMTTKYSNAQRTLEPHVVGTQCPILYPKVPVQTPRCCENNDMLVFPTAIRHLA